VGSTTGTVAVSASSIEAVAGLLFRGGIVLMVSVESSPAWCSCERGHM
jgi:hypothetical protein